MKKKLNLEEVKQEYINKNLIPLFNEYKNANKRNLAQKPTYVVNKTQ